MSGPVSFGGVGLAFTTAYGTPLSPRGLGPFVGLFGQHRGDKPDHRHLVREDPHDIRARVVSYRSTGGRSAEATSDAMTRAASRQP